jgi:GNAT superfamily N-acetyltransferase
MSIPVRRAESDADLEAWARVKREVVPNESAWTPQEFRERATPERLVLVAELDGDVVGAGLSDRSDLGNRFSTTVRVIPRARRRGVGTALLAELERHAAGFVQMLSTSVVDPGSQAFAERFGFVEEDRQVEQVRLLTGAIDVGPLPDGVHVVTVAELPELLGRAYPLAAGEGFADMAVAGNLTIKLDDWLRDEATLPAGSFVALADGEIVGYSGLMNHDSPGTAEDGLTVVARAWRRRGLARALKQRELAWAADNGLREIVTWTQRGNEAMRRLNERLGYEYRDVSITMVAPLPLSGLQ